jgi:hypothetical protein
MGRTLYIAKLTHIYIERVETGRESGDVALAEYS